MHCSPKRTARSALRKSTSVTQDLAVLRAEIDRQKPPPACARPAASQRISGLGIEFSSDVGREETDRGQTRKRVLTLDDIRALRPFHWPMSSTKL